MSSPGEVGGPSLRNPQDMKQMTSTVSARSRVSCSIYADTTGHTT